MPLKVFTPSLLVVALLAFATNPIYAQISGTNGQPLISDDAGPGDQEERPFKPCLY